MTSLRDLSDDDLQRLYLQKGGKPDPVPAVAPLPAPGPAPRVVLPSPIPLPDPADPTPRVPTTGEHVAPDLSAIPDAKLLQMQEDKRPVGFGEDLARTAMSKPGEGALRALGFPGQLEDWSRQGLAWMLKQAGVSPLDADQLEKARLLPNGQEMVDMYKKLTGAKFYDPKFTANKIIGKGLEQVPAAVAMGGGKTLVEQLINALRYGFAPGVAGEGAGQGLEALGADKGTADAMRVATTMITGAAGGLIPPRASLAPSEEALTQAGVRAMDAAKNAGIVIASPAVQRFVTTAERTAAGRGLMRLAPEAYPVTAKMIDRLGQISQSHITFDELHAIRKTIRAFAQQAEKGSADENAIMSIKGDFDQWVKHLDQRDLAPAAVIVGGRVPNVQRAARSFRDGIKYFTRAGKAEELSDIVNWARDTRNLESGYSFEQALRARLKVHTRNPMWMRMFTPPEQRALRSVVGGGPIDRILAVAGSGGGMSLSSVARGAAYSTAAGAFTGPKVAAAIYGAGIMGRQARNALTRSRLAKADLLIRGGAGAVPGDPMLSGIPMAAQLGLTAPDNPNSDRPLNRALIEP